MNFENPVVWIVAGVACLLILSVVLKHFFSEEARVERRRRKSNTRIVSIARKPTVRFSVKTPKRKE